MTIDPWRPTVRDGRIYGRGSCDIKGGMTAMLGALARLVAEAPRRRPTLIMACTVNEEHGYSGATALTRLWTAGDTDSIFPRAPDAAVIAEPTNLDVVVAHKGAVRWRCHTHGRAAHSSQPQLGDNAIYKMARVVAALESYARDVPASLPAHPLCGRSSLSVGVISGGLSVNTVPDRATIEIDRRIIPGEDGEGAYRQVVEYVTRRVELRMRCRTRTPLPRRTSTRRRPEQDTRRPIGRGRAAGARASGRDRRPLRHRCRDDRSGPRPQRGLRPRFHRPSPHGRRMAGPRRTRRRQRRAVSIH